MPTCTGSHEERIVVSAGVQIRCCTCIVFSLKDPVTQRINITRHKELQGLEFLLQAREVLDPTQQTVVQVPKMYTNYS